jgi:hypothetical protein
MAASRLHERIVDATNARITQAAARYGEHAPMAGVCCNACRTCTTTNVIALGTAAVGAAGVATVRFARRLRPSQ